MLGDISHYNCSLRGISGDAALEISKWTSAGSLEEWQQKLPQALAMILWLLSRGNLSSGNDDGFYTFTPVAIVLGFLVLADLYESGLCPFFPGFAGLPFGLGAIVACIFFNLDNNTMAQDFGCYMIGL